MQIGDLVRPTGPNTRQLRHNVPLVEEDWAGIIIDWDGTEPIVFWNDKFPAEIEYREQLEVISENRRFSKKQELRDRRDGPFHGL